MTTETQQDGDIRIRYGARERGTVYVHDKGTIIHRGQAKNTLATIRKGDVLYFGIARCDKTEDTFTKANGRTMAEGRALKTMEKTKGYPVTELTFMGEKLDRGMCPVENVRELLEFFDALDTRDQRKLTKKYSNAPIRLQVLAGISD